jgi:hypothetical protein
MVPGRLFADVCYDVVYGVVGMVVNHKSQLTTLGIHITAAIESDCQ